MQRGQSHWPKLCVFRTDSGEAYAGRLPWTMTVERFDQQRAQRYYFRNRHDALKYAVYVYDCTAAELKRVYGKDARRRAKNEED